jgi:Tfp pilus assembly protein PilF
MLRSWFLVLSILLLAGCSMPRVIVLHDPLDARQHNDLGVVYQADEEFDLALREYQRAAELDEHWARPLINGGNTLVDQNRWPEAAEMYQAALERQPDHAEAMNNLAWVLLRQGKVAQARIWADRAVVASPQTAAFLDTLDSVQECQEQAAESP